jgi:hypothetical protein
LHLVSEGASQLLGVPFRLASINVKRKNNSEVSNQNSEELCLLGFNSVYSVEGEQTLRKCLPHLQG